MTVAVIGGGAVGVTAARELATADVEVTLYEATEIGGGSTGRAAGIIYGAHGDAVNAALGRQSLTAFRTLSGTEEFTFVPTPYVWFATEPGTKANAIREQVTQMDAHDIPVALLSPEDLARRWPSLTTQDIEVAAMTEAAGWLNPTAYAEAVATQAQAAGATIETGTSVSIQRSPLAVTTNGTTTEVETIAVAAGAHTPAVLRGVDIDIPVKPYRVQALTIEGPSTPMYWDVTTGYYARPHPSGVLAGDGTERTAADPDNWRRAADETFLSVMTERLHHRLDGIGTVNRGWAGLCTATPDRDPLLGPVASNIYIATGWQGHGVMRAPATGAMLATAVLDGNAPEPRFDPDRFDGDETFTIQEGMTLPDSD